MDFGEAVWIDDFEVTCNVSPEQPAPTPEESYEEWATRFGLSGGDAAMTNDVENGGAGDGLNNLVEYSLGGNPTLDDASAFVPVFEFVDIGGGSNRIDYVFNRRIDAGILGLTYGLNQGTNLMGEWDYVGDTFETGSAEIDLYFESVTNSVPFGSDQGYIQLEVEGDF